MTAATPGLDGSKCLLVAFTITMPRLFVAIDLPATVRQQLADLKLDLPGARWVRAEQMHLTLRFIGEVADDFAQEVKASLQAIKSASFNVRLQGVGYFPPRRAPRVLWVGLAEDQAEIQRLKQLYERVEQQLVSIGVEPEKRAFSPHITLARLNNSPAAQTGEFVRQNSGFATESLHVTHFHLYASTLHPQGARYERLASYALEETDSGSGS